MLQPWNNSSVLSPPVSMFLCDKKVDISGLTHVCNNVIKVLCKQSPLHKESALCSRFLYKYDRKFSNDIGYRNFRKVHTALKKYLTLNLLKDVQSFLSALPSEKDDEKYLPTRQMLEYVMLRIIAFSKIMLRVCVCSKQSAIFYLNRLKRGEAHWMSLLPYALLSRLWSMSMVLVQHSTSWYANLHPYLNILECKGMQFLPDSYELPLNLEQWLDLSNIDCFGRFHWDQRKFTDVDNILQDDDENDTFENILCFVTKLNKNELEESVDDKLKSLLDRSQDQLKSITSITQIDYGEVVSRDSFTNKNSNMIKKNSCQIGQGEYISRENLIVNKKGELTKKNNLISHESKTFLKQNEDVNKKKISLEKDKDVDVNVHTHLKVTNSQSLKEFIKIEEKFRNNSNIKSLTNHLSLMQWHALKKALIKLCDTLTNRKIEKKFQRIWLEKCLEYK